METVIQFVDALLRQGIISDYALGGSVGFMMWTQPFLTNDTDFFVQMPTEGLIVSLAQIYDYATQQGLEFDHEHILVDDEAVQIVPSPSPMYDEAIATAVTKPLGDVTVKVMLPEYLICTALKAGRLKDFTKIEKMLDEVDVDLPKLQDLIQRFGLASAWRRYCSIAQTTDPKFLHLATTKRAWRRSHANWSAAQKIETLRCLRNKAARYRPVRT